jgi:hypothetical protein
MPRTTTMNLALALTKWLAPAPALFAPRVTLREGETSRVEVDAPDN